MADNRKEKLFAQFPPVTTEQWEEVINADLKGADYQKKLVWKTAEGFSVRPYYRAEDLKGLQYLSSGCGEFPYVRGNKCRNHWKIHETIRVDSIGEANRRALRALEGGAESIGFMFGKCPSANEAKELLDGIVLEAACLVFTGELCREAVANIMSAVEARKADPEQFRAAFTFDPLVSGLSLHGEFPCKEGECFTAIAGFVKTYAKYRKVRFCSVGGHHFHNSGSTIVQELGFTLAAGHEYMVRLMEAGLTATEAARTLRFSMAVSSNYFMEIAKFRAGRMLWANIVKAYDPECGCAEKMKVHAVTSMWNMTVYDPYVNMLRGTTEAMSASLAGVYSLEVLPFDAAYENPTDFSARIARNVQLLLKNESHFDNVVDPAGGSYYIETLTQSIADEAWKLFRQAEDKGGYTASFREGFVTGAIEESARAKDKAVATRRTVLLGTNQYPNFLEVADKAVGTNDVKPAGEKASVNVLIPYRGAMPFEQLRLEVDRSGKSPRAFMLTCGTLAMARARSQFACNFFACAGIRVEDNTFFKSVEEGAAAALKSGAGIVVICAADDDYAALAPQARELLGGKAIFVVAGDPSSRPELEASGITNFINVRSNVLDTLRWYVKELGI
jgi:methylmalonyl-CoA mutase